MAQEGIPPTHRRAGRTGGLPTKAAGGDAAEAGGRRGFGRPPAGAPPGPPGDARERGEPALPAQLAGQFEVIGPPIRGGEADVWHVREVRGKRRRELALKLYHRDIDRDQLGKLDEILTHLRRRRKSPHLMRVVGTGTVDGQFYTLAEWVPGGTLADMIREHRGGIPVPVIRDIVGQLAEALTELHGHQIVHLDVKPGNVAIRPRAGHPAGTGVWARHPAGGKAGGRDPAGGEAGGRHPAEGEARGRHPAEGETGGRHPAEGEIRGRRPAGTGPQAVLIDFGSAVRIERRMVHYPDPPHTTAYASPEVLENLVSLSSDWWSLGMTVAEMATGSHPLAGMTEESIRWQVVLEDEVPIAEDIDPQVRLLCEGLLVRQRGYRWGTREVRSWLAGDPPDPPAQRGPEPSRHLSFAFDGQQYTQRIGLAAALATHWSKAAADIFGPAAGRWPELRGWLAQFDDPGAPETSAEFAHRLDRLRLPPEPALLVLLRWLHPGGIAVYLGYEVNLKQLPKIAAGAVGGDQISIRIVEDLWAHRLLPHLGEAPDGGGLAGVDARWRAFADDWDRARGRAGALRPDLERCLRAWQGTPLLAWLLWLASDPARDMAVHRWLASAKHDVRAGLGDPRARLDWFDELIAGAVNPAARLAAYAVSGLARAEVARIRRQREAEFDRLRARRRRWRQLELARGWDRPVGLGWAAAAAAIVAAGWFVLLQIMGGLDAAAPAVLSQAWIFASCAAVLQITIELSLAAVIGGPYHPRYSLMTPIVRAAGWTGRTFSRPGTVASLVSSAIALAIFAAAAGVLMTVTRAAPFLLPLIAVPVHARGAYRRHRRWRADYTRRRGQVLLGHAAPARAHAHAGAAGNREPREGEL